MGSAGSGKAMSTYCMVAMVCVMVLGVAMGDLTCCDVKPVVKACGDYVKSGGDRAPEDCCMNALELRNKVTSARHSQYIACRCLQESAMNSHDHINSTAYASLPSMCGIYLPYQFSIDMDCESLAS